MKPPHVCEHQTSHYLEMWKKVRTVAPSDSIRASRRTMYQGGTFLLLHPYNAHPNLFVSRDGCVLKRYEPTDQMTDIVADICLEVYIK